MRAGMSAPSRTRLVVGVTGLLIIIGVTLMAGRWQLSRADEKRALVARIAQGRALPPLALTPAAAPADTTEWREAVARGRWLPAFTVLVENRNHQGQPGFWVVTPLQFDAPARDGDAVAVLRGWIPRVLGPVSGSAAGPSRQMDAPTSGAVSAPPAGAASGAVSASQPGAAVVSVPTPTGRQEIRGELIGHVPRLLELGSLTGAAPAPLAGRFDAVDGPPRVQNIDVAALAAATGLNLLPMVLQQTGQADDGLVRDWAPPPDNVDTHLGYAMQWFSFAAIAAIALGVLLVRRFRSTRR
jgi:cytochrome oxidase assembly protein ShyY1